MRKYAFFLGCTIPVRSISYEISARKVLEALGIELVTLKEFSCCGPAPLYSLDFYGALAISARNLSVAAEKGLDILTLCSGCFETLLRAKIELEQNVNTRKKVEDILNSAGRKLSTNVNVKHIAILLAKDIGVGELKKKVSADLKDISVATFPGCHLFRPGRALRTSDNPQKPKLLDKIVEALGAKPIEYTGKYECCGGTLSGIDQELSMKMMVEKLRSIAEEGADCIVTACPFCFIQFDMGQQAAKRDLKENISIPVLYLTELIGLAFGIPPEELGLNTHASDVSPLLSKISRDG
ncbi:MAG: CoB--CoM heterodisulfide reductase iron-sulfur subunit B family protein [Candidatus Baldrarchaeia archaeon]